MKFQDVTVTLRLGIAERGGVIESQERRRRRSPAAASDTAAVDRQRLLQAAGPAAKRTAEEELAATSPSAREALNGRILHCLAKALTQGTYGVPGTVNGDVLWRFMVMGMRTGRSLSIARYAREYLEALLGCAMADIVQAELSALLPSLK
jgi:hypothetical protein